MNAPIPFLDLVTPYRDLEEEFVAIFRESVRTGRFIGGPVVENFEREFAAFCGAKHCIGVGSGTDALRFALIAAGIVPGDVVITVPNTFIATTEAISQAGARPAFVDVDPRTYNMDPERLREFLTTRCATDRRTGQTIHLGTGRPVTAVIPVHLYGQTADMDAIRELADNYRLLVFEDACQAHGAEYYSEREKRWQRAGSIGIAGAFSFYPGKNLGAFGEAGAVTTDREDIAAKIRMIRDHGQARKYYHDMEGYNGRLDAIQAGILAIKLRHLELWNRQRREAAARYDELLKGAGDLVTPWEPEGYRSVYHLYVIRTGDREGLQKHLADRNIATGLHYPLPLHRQKAYASAGFNGSSMPVAERSAGEILSLPMYPGLGENEQRRISEQIRDYLGRGTVSERSAAPARQGAKTVLTPSIS